MSELVKSLNFGHRLTPDGYFDTARTDEIMFAAAKRIAELESSLADSNEALRVMWLKLSHAEHDIQMHRYGRAPLEEKIEMLEAQLQSHSANTLGGPTPVAAPACEPVDYEYENMCPNCVTPWKCNGPHVLHSNEDTRTTGESASTSDERMNQGGMMEICHNCPVPASCAIRGKCISELAPVPDPRLSITADEFADMVRDAKRMQWMSEHWGYGEGMIFFEGFNLGANTTLREAIDAAMQDNHD